MHAAKIQCSYLQQELLYAKLTVMFNKNTSMPAVLLTIILSAAATAAGAAKISYDAARQTATLAFLAPIKAGAHVLVIDYSGKINQHATGLFSLDYDAADVRKSALFTQFENSDARRFLPSRDEPARKQ